MRSPRAPSPRPAGRFVAMPASVIAGTGQGPGQGRPEGPCPPGKVSSEERAWLPRRPTRGRCSGPWTRLRAAAADLKHKHARTPAEEAFCSHRGPRGTSSSGQTAAKSCGAGRICEPRFHFVVLPVQLGVCARAPRGATVSSPLGWRTSGGRSRAISGSCGPGGPHSVPDGWSRGPGCRAPGASGLGVDGARGGAHAARRGVREEAGGQGERRGGETSWRRCFRPRLACECRFPGGPRAWGGGRESLGSDGTVSACVTAALCFSPARPGPARAGCTGSSAPSAASASARTTS